MRLFLRVVGVGQHSHADQAARFLAEGAAEILDDVARFLSPLAEAVLAKWQGGPEGRLVVCTGGEPLLQLDEAALVALQEGQLVIWRIIKALAAEAAAASAARPHVSLLEANPLAESFQAAVAGVTVGAVE